MFALRFRIMLGFAAGVAIAVVTLLALQSWRVDAAPGVTDATFAPITPCRLIDTRPAPDRVGTYGAFGIDDTRTISARGAHGNCVIPDDAVGLSLNVTAIDASAPTFVTIWPDGARPKASSLNPVPGEPPTPNAVSTSLSATGAFNIYNLAGSVDVIVDVNGYYTRSSLVTLADEIGALQASATTTLNRLDAVEAENTALHADLLALQTEVSALQAVTASMSLETVDGQPVVRFTGVNVQIVDGQDLLTDGPVNGRGNLIIGYNELGSDTRTGSHNLVVGPYHTYTSYGGFVTGFNNNVTAGYASVSGGLYNTASNFQATVSGGYLNTASGEWSSVSGGYNNTASGANASVSGGDSNMAGGGGATVSGGFTNTADGTGATVSGGSFNAASGSGASVTGGTNNTAGGDYDTVVGGDDLNCAEALNAVVCGEGAIVVPDS